MLQTFCLVCGSFMLFMFKSGHNVLNGSRFPSGCEQWDVMLAAGPESLSLMFHS